jgi:hypothetical protein
VLSGCFHLPAKSLIQSWKKSNPTGLSRDGSQPTPILWLLHSISSPMSSQTPTTSITESSQFLFSGGLA